MVSADFNNDGISDIAAASEGEWRNENAGCKYGAMVCLGSSEGFWCNLIADEKTMDHFYADKIVTGDVNGDGNADIAMGSLQHRVDLIVWLGDGKGGFTPFNHGLPTELHYKSVALVDINRDGRDDLVASITGFGLEGMKALKVYLSDKDGFKDISSGLPNKESFFAVATGDLTVTVPRRSLPVPVPGGSRSLPSKMACGNRRLRLRFLKRGLRRFMVFIAWMSMGMDWMMWL